MQETGRLNDVACDTYHPRFLFVQHTVHIGVNDVGHFAGLIMVDFHDHRLRA